MKSIHIYKVTKVFLIFLITILMIICLFKIYANGAALIYDYENSNHHEVIFKDGYVTFRDEISVINNTNKDLYFYMTEDAVGDIGLVTERYIKACEENSLQKEKFFIKANSEERYMAYFKAKKGDKNTKDTGRVAPKKVMFEIIE